MHTFAKSPLSLQMMPVTSSALHELSAFAAGPMINGATQVLFEGVPTHPDAGRAWDIVDKYKVCCHVLFLMSNNCHACMLAMDCRQVTGMQRKKRGR